MGIHPVFSSCSPQGVNPGQQAWQQAALSHLSGPASFLRQGLLVRELVCLARLPGAAPETCLQCVDTGCQAQFFCGSQRVLGCS